jgi:putative ABC transport system ATP-binding protein
VSDFLKSLDTEDPLPTTAERKAVVLEQGIAPGRDWVIVTRALKRDYDMGGEVVHALRGVDLAVRRNEYVAIMGPSGSASRR